MKIAVAHDYLSQPGGAERVVLELARLLDATIVTSFYEPEGTFRDFRDFEIETSHLQGRIDADSFRRSVLRFPSAFRDLDVSSFDAVVISSSAFAHHLRHPRSVVYCHTPPRFLYDSGAYMSRVAQLVGTPLFAGLRASDRRAAKHHLAYAANSNRTSRNIERCYGRRAEVIYPPLALGHLPDEVAVPAEPGFALVVSRLLPYKRVDLAIEACRALRFPLVVVGEGPEEERLRDRARGADVDFKGRVGDTELRALFSTARVVLAPGVEDFGYGPVEANYAGLPVVAPHAGGALETMIDGETGVLAAPEDPAAWTAALEAVLARGWDAQGLRDATRRFWPEVFRARFSEWFERTLLD
jgi:glycosyltransferase involved in cell wall biosynthesis